MVIIGYMPQKSLNVIATIIKVGLCVLPALALIVAGNVFANFLLPGVGDLFFPFITGKNFFFRIMVEILFGLWAVVAIFDKKYRPKSSLVLWTVLATAGILILSTIFGANAYRSFWSNFERMEGLVGHLHLLAYFIVLISVFKSETDWRRFFYSSIGVSFIVSAYSYLQFLGKLEIHQSSDRLDATLGNATYLAIYLIFHIFLITYYAFKEKRIWVQSIFTFLAFFEIPIVFLTATRGAVLGLMGGAALLAVLMVWLEMGGQGARRSKIFAAVALGAVFLLLAAFFMLRNTNFIHKNYVLKRFADISTQEQTVKSRITIWGMAMDGFKERPILGWGLENFNLVFNKYYKAELWPQEPWFDRAHNVFFDWLSAGGILGLLSYLSIFGGTLYVLWRKQSDKFAIAAITSLFAAYFFHNIFVFDNLVSYFMFFAVLGFVHFLATNSSADLKNQNQSFNKQDQGVALPFKYIGALFIIIFVTLSLYFINIKAILASESLIDALKNMAGSSGDSVEATLASFDKVFSYNSFGTGEAREQLAGYANNIIGANVPTESKIKVVGKAVSEMEKQVAENPKDVRAYLFLAALYAKSSRVDEALKVLDKAKEFSPQKQQIYFLLADAYISKGDNTKAFEILKTAYDLDPTYPEAAKNLALAAILNRDQNYADEILMKTFGNNIVADQNLIAAYAKVGDFKKVRDTWMLFISQNPLNAQYYVNLAATYMQLGERQNAVVELRKAIQVNPQFKDQGEQFIREIEAGRNP